MFTICWSGHDWRADRKSINAVFTLSTLKTFQPIFNCHFADFAKSLEKHVDQPEFDFTKHIFLCNIAVICSEYGRPVRQNAETISVTFFSFQKPIFALIPRHLVAVVKILLTRLPGEISQNLLFM